MLVGWLLLGEAPAGVEMKFNGLAALPMPARMLAKVGAPELLADGLADGEAEACCKLLRNGAAQAPAIEGRLAIDTDLLPGKASDS